MSILQSITVIYPIVEPFKTLYLLILSLENVTLIAKLPHLLMLKHLKLLLRQSLGLFDALWIASKVSEVLLKFSHKLFALFSFVRVWVSWRLISFDKVVTKLLTESFPQSLLVRAEL